MTAADPGRAPRSRVRRSLLTAYVAVARSRWTRLCDIRVISRPFARMWEMTLADVSAVLAALEDAGLSACIAGGWGVDALLGRQTRRHTDLDVFVVEDRPSALDDAVAALRRQGYDRITERPADGDMPAHTALVDRAGHFVDLLPLDVAQSRLAGLAGPDPLVVPGRLGGRRVPCLSPRLQLAVHEGVPRLSRRTKADIPKLQHCLARSGAGDLVGLGARAE